MSIALPTVHFAPTSPCATPSADELRTSAEEVSRKLKQWFEVEFTILDGDSGRVLYDGEHSSGENVDGYYFLGDAPSSWGIEAWSETFRAIARGTKPQLIEVLSPLLLLAFPCSPSDGGWENVSESDMSWVAVGRFVTCAAPKQDALSKAAEALGIGVESLASWVRRQTPIAVATLERLAALVLAESTKHRRVCELEREVANLSQHLCNTYEEISLIHQLTDNLTLSRREDDLAQRALGWLSDILPAAGMAILRAGNDKEQPKRPSLLTHGDCPLDVEAFLSLIETLNSMDSRRLLVVNRPVTSQSTWPAPGVREMIVVPLTEGDNFFGWLAAFNHTEGGEFGSVEANLLASVSAILGVHRGNTELYREQAELMCNMVHALTSAIDAKDPYTCGHSDRVARVAVRLARELGCDQTTVETIYLAGLLHDVGKIGIDDQVLRKPGRLTDEEYEHIKLHPQLGYNILSGIKQLAPVLPVVLHHHEAWDGSGYPHGLVGEDSPFLARVTAVADAFDAMGSDRVYRKGLSDERLDTVMRNGAGKQWDAAVVEAFFRVRDDIRDISLRERDDDVPEIVNLFLT